MKYSSCAFLARAHIRSGRRSTSVFVLLLLSIVLLTLVLSFGFTMQEVMYSFKNQDPVRRLRIDSSFADIGYTPLSKRVLEEIEHMEHVKSVDIIDGMSYQFFDINAITDEHGDDCSAMLPEKKRELPYSVVFISDTRYRSSGGSFSCEFASFFLYCARYFFSF